jgi:iron complex transport system ATP-binding protein
MNMKTNGILTLDSLKIGYYSGKHEKILLPPLNAHANRGELIAVIGRNGIGKSTLLRTLAGIQSSLGGEIYYEGKSIHDYSRIDLALTVGYISTEVIKVSNLSVYDLLALGRFPHTNWIGSINSVDHEAIMDALETTSMSDFCERFVSELSDGERQRAMIARLLAQDTEIMIMDEPTAFLDIGNKYRILHLMHELSQKNSKTIIFSTHDLQMAVCQADKIWLLLDDKLIEGAPEDLMIEGAFAHLFDLSPVHFDSNDGNFSFKNEENGKIYIEGEGIRKHWVEKAINRVGYSSSEDRTDPYISISAGNEKEYLLNFKHSVNRYGSVYDLVGFLGRENILPI